MTANTLDWLKTEQGKLIAAIAYASPRADMSYAIIKLAYVNAAIDRAKARGTAEVA